MLTVGDRPLSHSSRVKIVLCIAAIATRRSDPLAVLAVMTHAAIAAGAMAMAIVVEAAIVVTLVGKFT